MRRLTLLSALRRGFLAFALAFSLLVSTPQKAHAQYSDIVTEIQTALTAAQAYITAAADVAGWAAEAAQYIKMALQWAIKNLDSVISMLSKTMSSQTVALSSFYAAQANIDSRAVETQKGFVTKISLDFSMNLPTNPSGTLGKDTGFNACAMTSTSIRDHADAISDLARALAYFTQTSKLGSTDSVKLKRLEEQCFRGLRDAAQAPPPCPDPATLTLTSSTGVVFSYVNADTDTNTIFFPKSSSNSLYYSVPKDTSIDPATGQIALPYVNQAPPYNPAAKLLTDPDEMNFVAAVFTCLNMQPAVPPPPIVTGAGNIADAGNIETYVEQLAGSSTIGQICAREVARRTRVSQAAANNDQNGGVLEEVYQAQLKRCQSQEDQGIFNPGFSDAASDFTDCQNNGRSELEMDYNEACKFKSLGYMTYLAGTGLTPNEAHAVMLKHDLDCDNFRTRLREQAYKISSQISQTFCAATEQQSSSPNASSRN